MTTEYHVGFTGSRNGSPGRNWKANLAELLRKLRETHGRGIVLHHGDCIGCDEMAHYVATREGCRVVIHPPIIETSRAFCEGDHVTIVYPKAFLARNHDIVNSSRLLIAVPRDPQKEVLRSGTWATIRYAKKRQTPIQML